MCESHIYILSLGSNTADRSEKINSAIERLSVISDFTAESDIYEFPDESGLGDPYLNKVIAVVSMYDYDNFRDRLKAIERELGRTEISKSTGIMPIDLDIIIYDNKIVDRYQFSREYFRIGYADLRKCEYNSL